MLMMMQPSSSMAVEGNDNFDNEEEIEEEIINISMVKDKWAKHELVLIFITCFIQPKSFTKTSLVFPRFKLNSDIIATAIGVNKLNFSQSPTIGQPKAKKNIFRRRVQQRSLYQYLHRLMMNEEIFKANVTLAKFFCGWNILSSGN